MKAGCVGMSSFDKTMKFNFPEDSFEHDVRHVLMEVYNALNEKGYNPIKQIVGYWISGDPGYISSYKDARSKIQAVDRAKVVEILLLEFQKNNK